MSASSARRPARPSPPWPGFWQALRRLAGPGRRPGAHPASTAPAIGLGVGPLPDHMERLPRGAPVALVARDARSAVLWFPALLADAVAASTVFLLVPSAPCADQLLEHAALRSAHAQGQLVIWVRTPGLQPLLHSHGLRPLFEELHSVGLHAHHALYVLDALALFAGLDVLQLQRVGEELRLWCLERAQPVVLGFEPPAPADSSGAVAPPDVLPMLRSLCSMTLHIATLSAGAEHSSLHFERWNSASGAVFQTGFGLALDAPTQQLRYAGSRTQGDTVLEAPDQRDVIATRAAIAQQLGVPRHWHIAETLEEVAALAAHSIGATVLLDAGNSSEFEARARLVHQLRLTRPPTLKIIVRESTGKLRSHSEQALLQLGANAVFYRELGFSRLLQLLQDIHQQSYVRAVHPDYQQALDAFMPVPCRGYQSAPEFSRLVHNMLDRTQDMGLGHSLVRLDMAPHIAHLTALRACHMSRDGDLVTASQSAVYVFLFACREPDIEAALQRLFDVPVAQLFTAQSTDGSDAGIRTLLEGLDQAARQGLPDYSPLLAPATPPATAASATTAAPLAAPLATLSPAAAAPASAVSPALPGSAADVLADSAPAPAQRPQLHARPIGQRRSQHPAS